MKTKKTNQKPKSVNNNQVAAPEVVPSTPILRPQPGAGQPLWSLRDTANRYLKEGGELEAELSIVDWLPADTGRVATLLAQVEEEMRALQAAKAASAASTSDLEVARRTCALTRNQILAGLRMALKATPEALAQLNAAAKGTSEVKALQGWYANIGTLVSAHQAFLQRRLGQDPVAMVAAHKRYLDEAVATQQTGLNSRYAGTAKVLAARNALVDAIDDMSLAAQLAFKGDKEMLKRFRKSMPKPSKKKPAATTPGAPAENDPPVKMADGAKAESGTAGKAEGAHTNA